LLLVVIYSVYFLLYILPNAGGDARVPSKKNASRMLAHHENEFLGSAPTNGPTRSSIITREKLLPKNTDVESGWAIGKCSPSVPLDRHVNPSFQLDRQKNASRMLAHLYRLSFIIAIIQATA